MYAKSGWLAHLLLLAAISISSFSCQQGPSNPTLRDRGQRAYVRGEYADSIYAYAQVLERKPEDPEANLGIGKAYLAQGDLQRARSHLTVAYYQNWIGREKPFEIAGYLAEAMAQDGDVDALYAFLKERAEMVGEPRDYLRWGDYAMRFDDPDTAEVAYKTACRMVGGNSPEPYLRLATLYENVGRVEEAVRRLRQAYTIDPDNEEVLHRLGSYVSVIGPTLQLPPDGR